jgi:hypothetical protein
MAIGDVAGALAVDSSGPGSTSATTYQATIFTKKTQKTSNEKKLKTYITYLPTSLPSIQERQRADSMKPMVWYTTPGEVINCGVAFFLSDFVLL